jgi:hypothetical protein
VNESKIRRYLAPERLKLLWLLVKKRGIDSAPQQACNYDSAIDSITKESEAKSIKGLQGGAASDRKTEETDS